MSKRNTVNVIAWGKSLPAYADGTGVVRVMDPVAGHYTVCHSLTRAQEAYVCARTATGAKAARQTLHRHGWVGMPTPADASRMLCAIRASGDDSLNGEPMTIAEIRALLAIAACQD